MAGSISIVGLGLQVPDDLTIGTLRELNRADVVMALPASPLRPLVDAERLIDLSELYDSSKSRRSTYEAMTSAILGAAGQQRVCFATYGSPVVGTDTTQAILRQAPDRGIAVQVLNAPSSIEAVCATIGLDPFSGIQIVEASIYLSRPSHWSVDSWLLLQQVPYVGSSCATHQTTGIRYETHALDRLQKLLTARYGERHQAAYVRTQMQSWPEYVEMLELRHLSRRTPGNAATLVIPPLARA